MKNNRDMKKTEHVALFGSPHSQSENLARFVNAVPNGILKCLYDANLTIIEVNESFLNLTGYTAQEIQIDLDGCYINLICLDDRQTIADEINKQIQLNGSYEASYKLLRKNGDVLHVLNRGRLLNEDGGVQILCCEISDITDLYDAGEALRLSSERHKIIMDMVSDIIFEWDLNSKMLLYSSDRWKQFGIEPGYEDGNRTNTFLKNIYPEDRSLVESFFSEDAERKACSITEFRFMNQTGKPVWCRLKSTCQYDAAGNPVKVIGIITDIDKEHRMIENLREKSEKDSLTGLYDKGTIGSMIEKYLSNRAPGEVSALLMIDIDNFKTLNDTMGHLFGDAVLSEFASAMKKVVRSDDIIGRVGGDEFSIFLKDIHDRMAVREKANNILHILQHRFKAERKSFHISCSVGIAYSPENGTDYKTLYKHADIALYCAKNSGKNQYAVYEPDMDLKYIGGEDAMALRTVIDSDAQQTGAADRLTEYVLHTLYANEDIEKALHLILEVVGRQFDVSRAYIFENSEDGLYTSNTFEWCNEGVKPEIESLQNVPYASLDNYENRFAENNIFYCRDVDALPASTKEILEVQGIRSMLQCGIRQNGKFYGFVGFDECTGLRLWDKQEISTLTLLAELISTFLLKKRAQDKERENSRKMREVLDLQDAYIYVIDQDTYEILYLNEMTKKLDSNAVEGMCCFAAFFGRKEPCISCPICIHKEKENVLEVYNPQYDVWTAAKASEMKWDGRDVYLVSCRDITKYKKQTQ